MSMDDIDETAFIGSISMFGDSLTEYSFHKKSQGPGIELSKLFARDDPSEQEIHVLDFGCAGHTTSSLKRYFKEHVIDGYAARFPNAPPALVTIWLGANDAVLPPSSAHVPIETFETNIKGYVDAILKQPGWSNATEILLITPPPLNLTGGMPESDDEEDIDIGPAARKASAIIQQNARSGVAHRTWQSKRKYAECIVRIAQEYRSQGVSRVDVLDLWTVLVQEALKRRGMSWEEDELPGCGLPSAKKFPRGWFKDGLHFGPEGYKVVTAAILEKVKGIELLARALAECEKHR